MKLDANLKLNLKPSNDIHHNRSQNVVSCINIENYSNSIKETFRLHTPNFF